MSGCIKYNDINYGASHGFATIGSNNGHDGTSGLPFLNNPGVVEDYVSRAIHTESILGKEITEQFYQTKPQKSYYLGCSTGGRQGFKEAQDFPEDFDGIVAGAPAFDLNALMYWTGQFFLKTGGPDSPNFISAAQWDLVVEDVLKQCDGLDGFVDGVIKDPDLCNYRPEALIGGGGPENCLTGAQAQIVRAVFEPVYVGGTLVYPRLQPGANSTGRFFNGKPHDYPNDWFRYAIYNDPEWDIAILSSKDWEAASQKNPGNAATWEGDLSRARDEGVKILHFHGLEDNAISSENSARYYNHVSQTMGLSSMSWMSFTGTFESPGWPIVEMETARVSLVPTRNHLRLLIRRAMFSPPLSIGLRMARLPSRFLGPSMRTDQRARVKFWRREDTVNTRGEMCIKVTEMLHWSTAGIVYKTKALHVSTRVVGS